MEIININRDNIYLVNKFLENEISKNFRYFNTRKIEDVIQNHKMTVIGCIDSIPIAYGHLDKEDEKLWLGICILEKYTGKGYGNQMMKYLIKSSNKEKISLTVDNDNMKAINLYKKFNFIVYEKKETITYMNLETKSCIKLPVSFGEAFDKLSILDIKLEKIKDNRVLDVKKEYDSIYEDVNNLMDNDTKYHYQVLKKINLSIWEMQDIFRESKDENYKNKLCNIIIEDNDRRFRVKSKINILCNSSLKEQKGYSKKNAFVLSHLGLGDHINYIGLVRYLSTCYDEVYVVCRRNNYKNLEFFYSDDPSIKLICTDYTNNDINNPQVLNEILKPVPENCDKFISGLHRRSIGKSFHPCNILPFNFYKDDNIDTRVFWDYYHIPEIKESLELYNLIKDTPYIVTHTTTSCGVLFSFDKIERHFSLNKNDILCIDLNNNLYEPSHIFYDIAQKFVGLPLIYYTEILKNASKLILSDSCILCLALHLEIKSDECYYLSRDNNDYSHIWDFENLPTGIKKFHRVI